MSWFSNLFSSGPPETDPIERALELRGAPRKVMLNQDGTLGYQGKEQVFGGAEFIEFGYCLRRAYPGMTEQEAAMFAAEAWYGLKEIR